MTAYTNKTTIDVRAACKNVLLVFAWVFLLFGCGVPMIATEHPLRNARATITPGVTTRADVHTLLGKPKQELDFTTCVGTWQEIKECQEKNAQNQPAWEFYAIAGDAIGITLIPVPLTGAFQYYALITYDESDRVTATAWGREGLDSFASTWNRLALYADSYGYYVGTGTVFPSIDGGGKADLAWASYLSDMAFYQQTGKYGGFMLRDLCNATGYGHPCVLREIGNYFWSDNNDSSAGGGGDCHVPGASKFRANFHKNNVRACVWYAMANNRVLPMQCRETLSNQERSEVDRLLLEWQPTSCVQELAQYRCGSGGGDLCF